MQFLTMVDFRFIVLLISVSNGFYGQDIYINEFMSSNQGYLLDEYDEPSDWIEIINSSSVTINLEGYYLSDDESDLTKWQFPSIDLDPNEIILVFASGRNEVTASGELHTNFAIDSKGEILIINKGNELVHVIQPKSLNQDESYALIPDASKEGFVRQSPTPDFSNVESSSDYILPSALGGIYNNSFVLTLQNGSPTNQIYYTTNGESPSISDHLYSLPLNFDETMYSQDSLFTNQLCPPYDHFIPNDIKKCILIKAAVFNPSGDRVSPVSTNSYFFKNENNNHYSLPVVSLSISPNDLLDDSSGIMVPGVHWDENNPEWTGNYYQRGINWEKKSYFEYYDPNSTTILKQDVGLRTHGGNSRRFKQKGFKIYARRDYGLRWINRRFFQNNSNLKFKSLVLKPFNASWSGSGIENTIANQIAQNLEIDHPANRPIVLYINGEYWGVYYLEERLDDRYIETYYDVNKDSLDIIGNWGGNVREGNNTNFHQLYDFVENNNMADPDNYGTIDEWIDIDNFIDYQLFEIFIANYDWPANNMRLWRERQSGEKWRWMFFDGDGGFGDYTFDAVNHALAEEAITWSTNPESTLFLRKLLKNETFKTKFLFRLNHLLSNELSRSKILSYYLETIGFIKNEIPDQIRHHNFPKTTLEWENATDQMETFLKLRHCQLMKHVNENIEFIFDYDLVECELSLGQFSEINVFPNPNQGVFSVALNLDSPGRVMISITNLLGQQTILYDTFLEKGKNEFHLNQTNLSSGVYILKISTKQQVKSERVVIAK
jgi:hypothetical protein